MPLRYHLTFSRKELTLRPTTTAHSDRSPALVESGLRLLSCYGSMPSYVAMFMRDAHMYDLVPAQDPQSMAAHGTLHDAECSNGDNKPVARSRVVMSSIEHVSSISEVTFTHRLTILQYLPVLSLYLDAQCQQPKIQSQGTASASSTQ